jgi:glycosyltransferase involved in cell wall biosynthesis
MAKLLTFGLPVYNSMPYLPEAMESLLAQTSKNFNILAIVDDCTDGSVEYMESIRDPRLRVVRQPKSGLASALNRMLREVETPWLIRQDTDDVSYPNRVERLLENIEHYPDAGMFYSLAEYHPKEQCLGKFRCTRGTPDELRQIVKSGYLLSFCHPSVVLNAEKALKIGGYTVGLHVEDMDLWWRMALHYDIQFIPEVLIGYRQNSSSLTTHNLERAHIEGLYDQYLLLSHLYALKPQPFENVRGLLGSFISPNELRSKEKLRGLNMLLAEKHYSAAAFTGLRSFFASPSYFFKRLIDEFRPKGTITNGVSPRLYLQRKAEFWP